MLGVVVVVIFDLWLLGYCCLVAVCRLGGFGLIVLVVGLRLSLDFGWLV